MSTTTKADECGHRAETFDGAPLVCELRKGHLGWHGQSVRLRDRTEWTHWGPKGKRS